MGRPTGAARLPRLALASLALIAASFAARDAAIAFDATVPAALRLTIGATPSLRLRDADWKLLTSETASQADRVEIAGAARDALRSEPLNVRAMRQLALAGPPGRRAERLSLAQRISRREPGTQLALLSQAAEAGDTNGAVSHLDMLLTLLPDAAPPLYPALSALIERADFRRTLAAMAKRPWAGPFVADAMANGDPLAVAALITEAKITFDAAAPPEPLLRRLIESGHFDQARSLAITAGAAHLHDLDGIDFASGTGASVSAPLTWKFISDETIAWTEAGDGRPEFEVRSGAKAVAAERFTHFASGTYDFVYSAAALDGTGPVPLEWQVACAGALPLWRAVAGTDDGALERRARMTIPANCAYQHWRITALGADLSAPARFRIGRMTLLPAGGRP